MSQRAGQGLLNPTVRRCALVIEAAVSLVAARIMLKIVPFRRLEALFKRRAKSPEATGESRDRIVAEVSRAVWRAARALPFEVVCFPRAIAAQAMLRRRRVGTVLYYGAATKQDVGLTAHAWVQDGERGVVGHEEAEGFHVLARYPESDQS